MYFDIPQTREGVPNTTWWLLIENESVLVNIPKEVKSTSSNHKARLDNLMRRFDGRLAKATRDACRKILGSVGYTRRKLENETKRVMEDFPTLSERQAQTVYMNGMEEIIGDLQEKYPGSNFAFMAAMYQAEQEYQAAEFMARAMHSEERPVMWPNIRKYL